MNEKEYKDYIKEEKGYLLNKIWMDKCKKIYLYDKIYEYLEDNKLNVNIKDELCLLYKKQFNFKNIDLKNDDFNVYPESLNLENYKNIFYFKNFYIIIISIYELLKKNNILNDKYLNNLIKIHYIINNGKIIFKYVYNKCNNIFMYKQSSNFIFIPEVILYFHSNKNEMDEQYKKFKGNKNMEYDINNIINNNDFIQVDSFYLYDIQSKIEVSRIKHDNQINIKPIEFLINIYLTRKDIENKIKQGLINKSIEKYSIINKESMNKILYYFEYNKFVDFIEENIIDKNEDKILDEIMNNFYNNEYLMNLNNKAKKAAETLKSIKMINENDNKDYNDDIEIINDKVKNYIYELFGDIYIEDRKFLFGDKKIIMDYKFVKNYLIIGKFENSAFKSEIMLNFEQNKYTENYFSIFQAKGYNDFINELKLNNNFIMTSENKKLREIKINENYQFSSNKKDYNEGNTIIKFSHTINNDIQQSNILSSNNIQNIINDENLEFHEQTFSEKKNALNSKNNRQNNDIEESIISRVNNGIYKFKELRNILSIISDIEKIEHKMKMSLNSGTSEEYYLLNYGWFKKYLELNNVNDTLYEYLVKSVKNNINISNINMQNEMIVSKIISQIKPNIKIKFNQEKDNYYKLKDNELFNLESSSFTIKGNNILNYYFNFILISPETMKLLNKDFSFIFDKKLILLGDNKAFIKNKSKFIIEKLSINNNIFIPELFFCFFDENNFNNNLKLLLEEGYEQYIQYYLLFNNNYASPIFDNNNNSIGYAFKYEPSIKDYSIYQMNEHLKAVIKLYFNHAQLKNRLNSKELLKVKYLIFDIKYIQKIKEYYDYNKLEKELNNNIIVKQIMDSLEKNNKKIEHNILDDKKISLIINHLPDEINKYYNKKKFNNKIECQEIPDLIPFNNGNLFYYYNFELVDKSIYDLLLGLNNDSSLYEEKDNYLECIFFEKYIFINISNINNKYILEVCKINDDNNINKLYLLEYDNGDNFLKHIESVKDVEKNFGSLTFPFNNRISMKNENKKTIGFIYNLEINNKKNLSNEGNYKKSDNLIIDNNNKNLLNEKSRTNTINGEQKVSDPCFTQRMINEYHSGITPSSNHPINNKTDNEINLHNKPQISNNNQTNQIKTILECFPCHPKIGLQNVGESCNMNAILQCFCNILHFVDFFKFNSKVEKTINKYLISKKICLTSIFKTLIDNLWPYENKIQEYNYGKNTNNKFFKSEEFKNKISRIAANESKDLLNFIIITLHEELNETPKNSIYNYGANNQNINLYYDEALQYFLNNFKNENSIISKEFYAVNHTLIKCSQCQSIRSNYHKYHILIFPLEVIRKYKNDQCSKQIVNKSQYMFNANAILSQQNLQNINSVTLEDCFNYNERIDTFQMQNGMYCNNCKAQLTFFYQTKLYTSPEILIIVLNRGKGIDFRVKLEFDLFINITNYIELKDNNGWKYKLIGVVSHLGESDVSGHFIAYCKSPIDGVWHQYNNESVFEVKDFAKEIREFVVPEILFYQKINN